MRPVLKLPLLLFLALLLLSLPLLLRASFGHPLLPGAASYELLLEQPSLVEPYTFLSLLPGSTALLFSLLLGLLSLALFHLLAARMTRSPFRRGLLSALFLLNPLFLSLFTSLSPFTLALPLALLFLLAERRPVAPFLALLLALVAPLFTLLFLLGLLLLRRDRTLLASLAVALLVALPLLLGDPLLHPFSLPLVEFGALQAPSLLFVALALMEGVLRWRKDHPHVALLFLLLCLAPFLDVALLLLGLASAPFAVHFLFRLFTRRWLLSDARPLTLLLLACSILFLLLAQTLVVANAEPTGPLVAALQSAPPDGIVHALPEFDPFIAYFSGAATHAACLSCEEELFFSWRLDEAADRINETGVTHLLLSAEMRQGGVWNRDEEGVLFLLKHSERFALVSENGGYELWRWLPGSD